MSMIGSERYRRRTSPPDLREQIDDHLSWLQQRVAELDRELTPLMHASEQWKPKSDVLQPTPGVGPTSRFVALAVGRQTRVAGWRRIGHQSWKRDSTSNCSRRSLSGSTAVQVRDGDLAEG
jgi:transposase